MPYVADRVKDSTTTTGTGNLTLSGTAPTGYQTFNSAYGLNNRFPYVIQAQGSALWETGIGYLSNSTTLVRDTVLNSSSGHGVAVSLTAGTYDVFSDMVADLVDGANRGQQIMASMGQLSFL